MREYLFRGKLKTIGKWVYGGIRLLKEGGAAICEPIGYDEFRVDPATVGQYLGLLDKNGVKIYEGDIVKTVGKQSKKVRKDLFDFTEDVDLDKQFYDKPEMVWFNEGCFVHGGFLFSEYFNYEVIGNIHDNPELLEAGQ